MIESLRSKWKAGVTAGALLLAAAAASHVYAQPPHGGGLNDGHSHHIRHVLLISIDGMHALDFINCSKGINGVNGGEPYCPNLAALGQTGVNYLDTSTSKPSDSFPGLTALVSGGSPRTEGAFYDVAYDRSLDPPAVTTGNGVAAGPCTPGAAPTGTRTEYDEGIDIDQTKLNGGAPAGIDGGILSIDPNKLPRDPAHNCAPVYPWNFVRTNTIFGVIHAAGGYTAWSDKHPSYSSVSGPGNGTNVDDYYSPDINSAVVNLPGVITPTGISCATIPDPSQTGSWTDSFQNIQCYDTLKVDAILNEIDGKTHNGKSTAPVPAVFGMNFQVVSVGQKLIEKNVSKGGYQDAIGTPTNELLSEIQFADQSIGEMVSHLKGHGLLDSTLIIITAKHGQNPIDSTRFNEPSTTPATILDSYLPDSEKPSNASGIGPTEDDISLIWLSDSSQVGNAVNLLETTSPPSNNVAGIAQIFWGPAITQMFNSPASDPRTPDIIVTPNGGVVFTGSSKKLAEHGGFSHDDTNVMMLLSNPSFDAKTVTSPVETEQVAPTILQALGLDPNQLQAVQKEHTQVLPGVPLHPDGSR
jgi:hypothetical protein